MQLRFLCAPVLRLMQKLNYAVLFSTVGVVLVIPIVYLLMLKLSASSSDETFNRKEVGGVRYIAPTHDLQVQAQKRRLALVAQLTGQSDANVRLSETTTAVERSVQAVAAAAAEQGKWTLSPSGEDRTGAKLNNLRSKWQSAREIDAKTNAAEALAAQAVVAEEGFDFILNYLANFSNLILDPDLDSYWLMDAYVSRLPGLQETLTSLGTIAALSANAGKMVMQDRLRAAGLVEKARSAVSDLQTNFKTAYENNANGQLRGAIEASVEKALSRVTAYLNGIERDFVMSEDISVRTASVLDSTTGIVDAVHGLETEVQPQLEQLVEARVQNYAASYRAGLTTGAVALGLLVYILLSFYFQVSGASEDKQREIVAAVADSENLRKRAEAENQQLNSSIMDLLMAVATAADGDLTVRANVSEGALGNVADALNQMLESWNSVLVDMTETTEETQAASARITEASNSLATGAARQVEEIGTANKAVRAISDSIAQITQNAKTAAMAASRTQESAITGTESITNVITGMESLRANVQAGAKKIKNLGDRSMEITGIVGTIAKISEQTNMLALNAAIEAARAGEHGRGFSVVADQVRRLAERTEAATQEIRQLITGIQAETNESVAAIEEQTTAVEAQALNVGNGGQMLTRIQAESTQTAEIVADITTTATAQVDVAERAVRNMEFVTKIAEQARDGAQTTLAVSRALQSVASKLKAGVSQFTIKARDSESAAAPSAAPSSPVATPRQRRAPAGAR